MNVSKQEKITAIEALHQNKAITEDKTIRLIVQNIDDGHFVEEEVKHIVNQIYPFQYDEDENELENTEYIEKVEKIRAEKYLEKWDWLRGKLSEYIARGLDISELVEKYADVFEESDRCRGLL